jgi:hypothetical protein
MLHKDKEEMCCLLHEGNCQTRNSFLIAGELLGRWPPYTHHLLLISLYALVSIPINKGKTWFWCSLFFYQKYP